MEPKVHYHVHESSPMVPSLSQPYPFLTLIHWPFQGAECFTLLRKILIKKFANVSLEKTYIRYISTPFCGALTSSWLLFQSKQCQLHLLCCRTCPVYKSILCFHLGQHQDTSKHCFSPWHHHTLQTSKLWAVSSISRYPKHSLRFCPLTHRHSSWLWRWVLLPLFLQL